MMIFRPEGPAVQKYTGGRGLGDFFNHLKSIAMDYISDPVRFPVDYDIASVVCGHSRNFCNWLMKKSLFGDSDFSILAFNRDFRL